MADILLGEHRRIVEQLSSRLRALQAGDLRVPRIVLLRAPAGEGKSRIIRELFSKLDERIPAASADPAGQPDPAGHPHPPGRSLPMLGPKRYLA